MYVADHPEPLVKRPKPEGAEWAEPFKEIRTLNYRHDAEVYRRWMQLGSGDVIVGMAPLFHITGLVRHLAVAGLTGLPEHDAGASCEVAQFFGVGRRSDQVLPPSVLRFIMMAPLPWPLG